MRLMHRIGFGYTPSESPDKDEIAQAINQLENPAPRVGLRKFRQMTRLPEAWPEKHIYDLKTRIKFARNFRKEEERIEKSSNLSNSEKSKLERQNDKKHRIDFYDRLAFVHQPIYGVDPVRQRFIHFWINHFTVGSTNGTRIYMGHLYQDVIGNGIGGNFNDLAYNVTRHPGMLTYLDNVYSVGKKSEEARNARKNDQIGLNDNLARELMELHTVSPKAGYTEEDIHNAAKILAGWGHIFNHPNSPKWFRDAGVRDMNDAYFKRRAEPGKKIVMGVEYPSGKKALRLFVDDLSSSEFTIEFLSKKLCIHFISDSPAIEDIQYVADSWRRSNGFLPAVHKAVIERAAKATSPKLQWPLTWALSLARVSGGTLFYGWEDVFNDDPSRGESRVTTIMEELGQDFWSRRQPDGFSVYGEDWVSSEHMERRILLSSMIFNHGEPDKDFDAMVARVGASKATINLIDQAKSKRDKFILLACSKEMMGAV